MLVSTVYFRYSNSLNSGNSCISVKSWMTNLYFYLINPIWIVENLAIVDNLRLTKLSTISRVDCTSKCKKKCCFIFHTQWKFHHSNWIKKGICILYETILTKFYVQCTLYIVESLVSRKLSTNARFSTIQIGFIK